VSKNCHQLKILLRLKESKRDMTFYRNPQAYNTLNILQSHILIKLSHVMVDLLDLKPF